MCLVVTGDLSRSVYRSPRFPAPLPILFGRLPELDQPRLFRM
jgi:hypothetical protein